MDIKKLIKRSRSYRRFVQDYKVSNNTLTDLIKLARFSPSAGNRQPLKYIISNTKQKNSLIFPTLKWARDLTEWNGPKQGERPSAYIIILGDKGIMDSFGCDHGIAAQTILLGVAAKGLGGCMIASIDRELLKKNLKIKEQFEILLVLAIGLPKEIVILKDAPPGYDIRYYRDKKDRHIVP